MAKRSFAALPLRACRDKRLTLIHFRVLATIAGHDGMSILRGKGQGCWASTTTLALECDSHISNVSTAIGELEDFGYIIREKHPTRKKTWILRVRYEGEDLPGGKTSHAEDLPGGKTSTSEEGGVRIFTHEQRDDLPASRDDLPGGPKLICRPEENSPRNQSTTNGNIFPEGEKILLKQEKSSVETASARANACAPNDNVGKQLAIRERALKDGRPPNWTDEHWTTWCADTRTMCESAMEDFDFDHPNHGRARRLLEAYDLGEQS